MNTPISLAVKQIVPGDKELVTKAPIWQLKETPSSSVEQILRHNISRRRTNCHFDLTSTCQGSDHSAAFGQPRAATPACQSWASPLLLEAKLLASGDVEQNPGPPKTHTKTTTTFFCSICNKQITRRHGALLCNTNPSHWVHKTCTKTSYKKHHNTWTCPLHTTNTTTSKATNQTSHPSPLQNSNATNPPNLQSRTPSSPPSPQNTKATRQPQNRPKRSLPATGSSENRKPKQNRNLKILQLNINGIQSKFTELQQLLTDENIDIATIQETKLHPSNKTPEIPKYLCIRQDRPTPQSDKTKTNGGGLITYVREDVCCTNTASYTLPDIESQTITIPLTQTKNLILTNLYIPQKPSTTSTQTEDSNITTLFTRLTNIPNSLIVADVNAHSDLWYPPIAMDHRGEIITSLLQASNHVVLNGNTPTRLPSQNSQQPTSPDITCISSNLADSTTWKTKTALTSDHLPIIITINTKSNFRLKSSNTTFTNYKKANWDKYTNEIELALRDTETPDNIHYANKFLTNVILLADKHHIPKGRRKNLHQPLPKHINDCIKERNHLRSADPTDPRIITRNKEINNLISKHRSEQWKTKLDQIGDHNKNSGTLWNTINYLRGKKPPLRTNAAINFNGKPALSPQQKAAAFNKQFVNTVKHTTKPENRKINRHTKSLQPTPIHITSTQVSEAISNSSNNNSTGPDNINIRHLKHLGPIAIQYLTVIYNLALNLNIIPQIWKLAKIIPIPKPNKDPNNGTSYRPISLLSPIAKTLEKIILPSLTSNIPQIKQQHGFKASHSTTTALQQLTNQIKQGFNKKLPPERTIVVSLDLSKAFDTVNIHSLIRKLHQTTVPNTIVKFIANYIKGRKGFTLYQNSKSKQQQFKTGVPQGGVLSPILFNLYTSDIPSPPMGVSLISYADDMNPAASHSKYKEAEQRLQPYLHDIFEWTKRNDLMLNPDKSTATLFTSCTREQNTTLSLSINNVTIPTVKNPKILGLTLDPSLSFAEHARITKEKADSSIKVLKALTSTSWGKQKETLLATYKAVVLPVIEYASTVWSPMISESNLGKLQTTQNNALRIITGCTADTNTDHLHIETKTLPLSNHLELHASQLRQKSQLPTHPLHDLTTQPKVDKRRQIKTSIFDDGCKGIISINNTNSLPPTPDSISQNLKTIHTIAVSNCIKSYKTNPILMQPAPDINSSEISLPRKTRRILAQLRAGKSPILHTYLNSIDPKSHPSSICPLCNSHEHNTSHLFTCPQINTTLTTLDLWNDPVGVSALLQQWSDAQGLAGGGSGPGSGLVGGLDGATK